jgi:hypothetical protein
MDGDFGEPLPALMELNEETVDHRRLEAIMDPRPGRREEPNLDIGSEDVSQRHQDGDAGLTTAGLDARQVAVID